MATLTSNILPSTRLKEQLLRSIEEVRTSLSKANSLYEQWQAAHRSNPTGLSQKDLDLLTRTFKNHLLTVKWDCEDLEEQVELSDRPSQAHDFLSELTQAKITLEECRSQLSRFTKHVEEDEYNKKVYNKHGIEPKAEPDSLATNATEKLINNHTTSPTIIENPLAAEPSDHLLSGGDGRRASSFANEDDYNQQEFEHFDKSRIETSTSIFNNALYEHFEHEDRLTKGLNASQVFNNLTRPNDVYMDPVSNENEMILEMLETEYYNNNVSSANAGASLLAKSSLAVSSKYNQISKLIQESEYGKLMVIVLSFPLLLLFLFVI